MRYYTTKRERNKRERERREEARSRNPRAERSLNAREEKKKTTAAQILTFDVKIGQI